MPNCAASRERKPLKEYLFTYRSRGIFQKNVVSRVLEDVVKACGLVGEFRPRGGVSTTIKAGWPRPRSWLWPFTSNCADGQATSGPDESERESVEFRASNIQSRLRQHAVLVGFLQRPKGDLDEIAVLQLKCLPIWTSVLILVRGSNK
jgi:hypothetical protein